MPIRACIAAAPLCRPAAAQWKAGSRHADAQDLAQTKVLDSGLASGALDDAASSGIEHRHRTAARFDDGRGDLASSEKTDYAPPLAFAPAGG